MKEVVSRFHLVLLSGLFAASVLVGCGGESDSAASGDQQAMEQNTEAEAPAQAAESTEDAEYASHPYVQHYRELAGIVEGLKTGEDIRAAEPKIREHMDAIQQLIIDAQDDPAKAAELKGASIAASKYVGEFLMGTQALIRIDQEAAGELVQSIGESLTKTRTEIEKLETKNGTAHF